MTERLFFSYTEKEIVLSRAWKRKYERHISAECCSAECTGRAECQCEMKNSPLTSDLLKSFALGGKRRSLIDSQKESGFVGAP